jgi:hypothetical protein
VSAADAVLAEMQLDHGDAESARVHAGLLLGLVRLFDWCCAARGVFTLPSAWMEATRLRRILGREARLFLVQFVQRLEGEAVGSIAAFGSHRPSKKVFIFSAAA